MNTPQPLPPSLHELSKRLGVTLTDWWEHDADYYQGFFRRGHPEHRRLRYWQRDGVIRGLTIRGHAIGDTSWLQEPAWQQLEDLLLIDTEITELQVPPGVKRLDLSDCKSLHTVTFTDSELPLTDVFAQRSGIKQLAFPHCSSLRCLHLRTCAHLETITFASPPTGLGVLEVEGCSELQALPASAILPGELFYLDARGTQPNNCPLSFVNASLSDDYLPRIRSYLQELENGETQNNIVKLLINGNGQVGKTTLWCALRNQMTSRCVCKTEKGPGHTSTHGVDLTVQPLDVGGVAFRGWDFGGQELFHGTHQLFFAEEAINLLVLDAESEDKAISREPVPDPVTGEDIFNKPLSYFYARQKQQDKHGEFLLVQSKATERDPIHRSAQKLKEAAGLKVYQVDARDNPESVEDLRDKLVQLVRRGRLPSYGLKVPASWQQVREALAANLKKETLGKILDAAAFRKLVVDNCGVTDDEQMLEALTYFLRATGDIYPVGKGEDQRIIINLKWALAGIYYPLRRNGELRRRALEDNGRVYTADVFRELTEREEYTKADQQVLLDFMLDCKTCFRLDAEKREDGPPRRLVFPRYLNKEKPEDIVEKWANRSGVHTMKAALPYRDETSLHALICDLGRKAVPGRDGRWYFGIDLRLRDAREREDKDKPPLPDGNVLIELEPPTDNDQYPQLFVNLQDDEGKAWWPSVQKWINEAGFGELEWAEIAAAKEIVEGRGTRVQREVIEQRESVSIDNTADNVGVPAAVWLLTSAPGAKLQVGEELSKVTAAVATRLYVRNLRYDTIEVLRDNAKDYEAELIHLLGHARAGKMTFKDPGNPTGREFAPADLKRKFKIIQRRDPNLKVVLLNACNTEGMARELSTLGLYVIGTDATIKDVAAIAFAVEFYAAYFQYGDVVQAFINGLDGAYGEKDDIETYRLFYQGEDITPAYE